jgi:hypothetical protein
MVSRPTLSLVSDGRSSSDDFFEPQSCFIELGNVLEIGFSAISERPELARMFSIQKEF